MVAGGGSPGGLDKGWFVEPTVFADVDNAMRIAQEEIFGPVLSVIPYDDEDDAVRIANDSDYGLSGRCGPPTPSAVSRSPRRLRTGTVPINSHYCSDFKAPVRRLQDVAASAASAAPRASIPTSNTSRSSTRADHSGKPKSATTPWSRPAMYPPSTAMA